jgi:raffinose/stachyose/melibiose transport system permease protein
MDLANPKRVRAACTGVLIALLFLIPLLYVIMIALETPSRFLNNPLALFVPTLSNFSSAWQQADLGPEVANTVLYSVTAAAISTTLGVLIAFPIARSLISHASWLYRFFVIGLCFPLPIIPLFIESRMLHLFNNRPGYILLHVEAGIPFGVIILTAFISSIPRELDEAALLDGAPYFRFLRSVIVPLAWPSIVITFVYSLLAVYNDIIGPVVFLSTPSLFPVTVGVYDFYGSNSSSWTLLAAAVIIVSLPVLALFAVSQRQLLRSTLGITGMK